MKKIVFFIITYIYINFSFLFAHAISPEARYIKQNETWSGNISILDDTIIEEKVTLTIKPGTKILFYVAASQTPPRLIVKGKLLAIGDEKNKILFTSSKDALVNPVQEEKNSLFNKAMNFLTKKESQEIKIWGGIHFENIEENSCEIKNCIIEFARDGIVCDNSSPEITYSLIKDCQESGVKCNLKSNPIIKFNTFKKNEVSGIYCHQESSPDVISNIFEDLPCGIYCYQSGPNIIANNIFKNNSKGVWCQYPGASPVIKENKFLNNSEAISCEQLAAPKIIKNYFNLNQKSIYLQRLSNALIEKNIFDKNEYGVYCFQNSSPVIYYNKFVFNQNGIFLQYASYPIIKENFLNESNVYAIKIEKQSYELYQKFMAGSTKSEYRMGIGSYAPRNPGKKFEKNKVPDQKKFSNLTSEINAENNYWGVENTKGLNAKNSISNLKIIWDGYDEPTIDFEGKKYAQDKVDFKNWLQEWDSSKLQ
ncbi:right-handed parallel beta-helix repeat-containing protein [Candidatus Poribacteria bacterium]|nr:right-handed parallel beta-helix repeat-containing protein [Candidatus Poribacteria bacterium]